MTNPNSEKTVADQEKVERQSASDLTEGSLVKRLGQLALPFLIPNLLHLVVLVADRVWVGDVGTEAMAGLGVAHAALMICVTLLMGPAIGTLAGVARSIGAGDDEEARRLFGQGLLIGLCVGAFFAMSAWYAPAWIMDFMAAAGLSRYGERSCLPDDQSHQSTLQCTSVCSHFWCPGRVMEKPPLSSVRSPPS